MNYPFNLCERIIWYHNWVYHKILKLVWLNNENIAIALGVSIMALSAIVCLKIKSVITSTQPLYPFKKPIHDLLLLNSIKAGLSRHSKI